MKTLEQHCIRIRRNLVRATTAAGSGHLTSSLSAVELMTALVFGGSFRKRDRLIFSKGHAAPLLYALYAEAGLLQEKELLRLRKFGSRLEGHPMMTFPYTEAPTGSLGQGLSIGVGMALANAMDGKRNRVFVLLGDGEMAEGSVWEAIQFAGVRTTRGIIALLDVNRLGQSAATALGHDLVAYEKRFRAFGWRALVVSDGHDITMVNKALSVAIRSSGPVVVIAKTTKGKGISFLENKNGWHGKTLTKEQAKRALEELG